MKSRFLLMAGLAVAVPPLGSQAMAQPPPEPATRSFTLPEAPLILTRTVWRSLNDGKQIVVSRRYAVRITRKDDGYLVDGQLLDSSVDAPPLLAGLAEIERKRGISGEFPLLLDASGQIRQQGAGDGQADAATRDEAYRRARALLDSSALPPAQRRESGTFLMQLAAQGAAAPWPADLFNSVPGERHETRKIALPGGQEGAVDVAVNISGPQPDGQLQAIERTVTTILAGTAKTSRERWTLAPAATTVR